MFSIPRAVNKYVSFQVSRRGTKINGMDRMVRYGNEESSLQSPVQPRHPGQSTHTTATIIPTSPVTPILATCAVTATDKVTATTTSSTHMPDTGSAGISPSK